MRAKAHEKYEKKIEELSERYQHKTNECHEAWMSLTSANEQLEKVMMELDNKMFEARSLGNAEFDIWVKVGEFPSLSIQICYVYIFFFTAFCLLLIWCLLETDQTVLTQADCLKSITCKYENDKRHWATAIVTLQEKIEVAGYFLKYCCTRAYQQYTCFSTILEFMKTVAMQIMKREQFQLSQEAHECVESIPELYKMVDGVQALGEFTSTHLVLKMRFKEAIPLTNTIQLVKTVSQCEDLKQKYSEEQAKRKELYNYIQETKGKEILYFHDDLL